MRRIFWMFLGLGAGATGAVIASRWVRRQAERVTPAAIGRQARGGLQDLGKLVRESREAARQAAQAREDQIRGALPG